VNKQIQRLGIFLVICYLAVFVKLHQTQLLDVDRLNTRQDNLRPVNRKLNRARGKIVSADGALLAESIDVGDNLTPRRRLYPEGDLFGQVTGYFSGLYGSEGVEQTYDAELAEAPLTLGGIADLFTTKENVGNVTLTVRRDLQDLARQQLGDREGSVVVLDPRSGALLAFWSNPSFNPQELTEGFGDGKTPGPAQAAYARLNSAPGNPLLPKQFRERYLPGSTFKVVTSGVGLQSGAITNDNPIWPQEQSFRPPTSGTTISNFNGETCGGALFEALTISCNTAFMHTGLQIGGPAMAAGTSAFGFNQDVPIDLPRAARSVVPADFTRDPGKLAQTAIGQQDVAATPLQMAMVASAAANNGVIMKPHVMRDIRNNDAEVVQTYQPSPWLTAMAPDKAQILAADMLGPVNDPRGTAAGRIHLPAGMTAGGKTGTAQTGAGRAPVHAWFMGYAGPTGQPPKVAVAVVLLNQPNSGEATGGQVAAPVASVMLNKALEVMNQPETDLAPVLATTTTTTPPTATVTTSTTRPR
jgi:penicillin-binding protein A